MYYLFKYYLIGLFCCFLTTTSLKAGHIIGGEMTYTCLGNDSYAFRMLIYRDCACDNCATLGLANIAVYKCGGDTACEDLKQGMTTLNFTTPLSELNNIPQPSADCILSPPFVCVQEGVYEFEVNLPYSATETYHIVYQRCCRNQTINNIINPGNSGATFSTEIAPQAQDFCNNSPTFNNFPPTLICVNEFLEFDHSAEDIDGDSLVYTLCSPLLGGGTAQNSSACNAAEPNPPCPPPFNPITFLEPLYTADAPLSGNPIVSIDAESGVISGAPNIQGQFVVGVCVSEYRNGELLGSIKRDFQFNVTNCENIVTALVDADEQINYNTFTINSCGDSILTIQNLSTLEVFIEDLEWQFEWDGQVHFFHEWSPTITFPRINETYFGRLVLNPDSPCNDTAYIQVHIFPPVEAAFSWEQDSCKNLSIPFTNLSQPHLMNFWSFGDGNTSQLRHPEHFYNDIGVFLPQLIVEDTTACRDTFMQTISHFPLPDFLTVNPNPIQTCIDENITFSNISAPIDDNYQLIWIFENSDILEGENVVYSYTQAGNYDINLMMTNPFGCRIDSTFEQVVTILPTPIADFTFQPQEVSSLMSTVQFTNQSLEANNWSWNFGNGQFSILQNPDITYLDTGVHHVQLIVSNLADCTDSIMQSLYIIPEVAYFLPNAFSPNYDGINDVFVGVGRFQYIRNFQLRIWNRWGEQVFQSTHASEGWNGKKFNNGLRMSNGIYVYKVDYENPQREKIELKGFVTLLR